jgi:multicomponent Na+:H+ antiporter subunit D
MISSGVPEIGPTSRARLLPAAVQVRRQVHPDPRRLAVEAYVAAAVNLFTPLSMLKIWNGAFRGDEPDTGPAGRVPLRLVLPALALTAVTVALGLGAEGPLALPVTAAENLVDTGGYVEAVSAP